MKLERENLLKKLENAYLVKGGTITLTITMHPKRNKILEHKIELSQTNPNFCEYFDLKDSKKSRLLVKINSKEDIRPILLALYNKNGINKIKKVKLKESSFVKNYRYLLEYKENDFDLLIDSETNDIYVSVILEIKEFFIAFGDHRII